MGQTNQSVNRYCKVTPTDPLQLIFSAEFSSEERRKCHNAVRETTRNCSESGRRADNLTAVSKLDGIRRLTGRCRAFHVHVM